MLFEARFHQLNPGLFERLWLTAIERAQKLAHSEKNTACLSLEIAQDGSLTQANIALQNDNSASGNGAAQSMRRLLLRGRKKTLRRRFSRA